MITYVIPTRNRPEVLANTLWALGALRGHAASLGAEIIVVDNASDHPPKVDGPLDNGIPVRLIVRTENEGAASRNIAVQEANPRSEWIVMLDDDSFPLDTGFLHRLASAPPDVAAVSAPDLRRMVTRVQSAHLTYSAADVLESATIPPPLRRLPPGSILNAS